MIDEHCNFVGLLSGSSGGLQLAVEVVSGGVVGRHLNIEGVKHNNFILLESLGCLLYIMRICAHVNSGLVVPSLYFW